VNAALLIDSIVRQTTVLIAQVATATESRPGLAHTADEVFGNLVSALRGQGVTNKGIADMFGLTLRTYHNRVARLAESDAQHGRLLRESIYGFIEDRKSVRRAQVLERFSGDEPVLVAGLLRDLVTSELVFQSGSGASESRRELEWGHRVLVRGMLHRTGRPGGMGSGVLRSLSGRRRDARSEASTGRQGPG
jgi:hypothetical protein